VRESEAVVNDINMAFCNIRVIPREGKVVITFIFIKYVFYGTEEHGVYCEKRVKADLKFSYSLCFSPIHF